MATIKSFTDLTQSKALAEFLPLESADCYWDYDELQNYHRITWFEDGYEKDSQLRLNKNNVCAWSLAALFGVTSELNLIKDKDGTYTAFKICDGKSIYEVKDNPIDACYELIIKLHEQNLL